MVVHHRAHVPFAARIRRRSYVVEVFAMKDGAAWSVMLSRTQYGGCFFLSNHVCP